MTLLRKILVSETRLLPGRILTYFVLYLYSCHDSQKSHISIPEKSKLSADLLEYQKSGSTHNDSLQSNEFIRYCNSEAAGLIKTITTDEYSIECSYRTPELQALTELNQVINPDKNIYYQLLNEYKQSIRIILKLSLTNYKSYSQSHPEILSDSFINHLNFGMEDNFKLVQNTDTVSCEYYHLESSLENQSRMTFIIGFQKPKANDQISFILSDRLLFKQALIFRYNQAPNELPSLKL